MRNLEVKAFSPEDLIVLTHQGDTLLRVRLPHDFPPKAILGDIRLITPANKLWSMNAFDEMDRYDFLMLAANCLPEEAYGPNALISAHMLNVVARIAGRCPLPNDSAALRLVNAILVYAEQSDRATGEGVLSDYLFVTEAGYLPKSKFSECAQTIVSWLLENALPEADTSVEKGVVLYLVEALRPLYMMTPAARSQLDCPSRIANLPLILGRRRMAKPYEKRVGIALCHKGAIHLLSKHILPRDASHKASLSLYSGPNGLTLVHGHDGAVPIKANFNWGVDYEVVLMRCDDIASLFTANNKGLNQRFASSDDLLSAAGE